LRPGEMASEGGFGPRAVVWRTLIKTMKRCGDSTPMDVTRGTKLPGRQMTAEAAEKSQKCHYCNRKARVASAQSFTLWQQATKRSHAMITPLLLVRTTYECNSSRTSRSWWIAHSTHRQRRCCNTTNTLFNAAHLLPTGLRFEHGSAKLASYPGCHLTSLRPWVHTIVGEQHQRWTVVI